LFDPKKHPDDRIRLKGLRLQLRTREISHVALEYRLGVFGFVGSSELTAESPQHTSGNYAILDQIAALFTDVVRGLVSFSRNLIVVTFTDPAFRTDGIRSKGSGLEKEVSRRLDECDFRGVHRRSPFSTSR